MTTESEYQSVDLTEDEGSSDDLSYENSPLHFVDCSMAAKSMSPQTGNTAPSTVQTNPSLGDPKPVDLKEPIDVIEKEDLEYPFDSEGLPKTSIGKFLSIQIKPPIDPTPEMHNNPETSSKKLNETVCLDSDEEDPNRTLSNPPNLSHSNNPPDNPQKRSGKVVVIKKNNKYYKIVIPHNVMPDVSQSVGPVLINIPEVGPLVITTDPKVKRANATSNSMSQQLLNLDDIDQKGNSAQDTKSRRPERDPREVVLCDKKYCWTLITGRKRDLEGFAMYDRVGFNRAEANRAKKCWKTLESIVSKRKRELIGVMQDYNKFKDGVFSRKPIKYVKINEIVGRHVSNGEKGRWVSGQTSKRPRHKKHKLAPHTEVHEPPNEKDEAIPYSDLLLTKKVVILNENSNNNHKKGKFRRTKLSKREKAKRLKERIKKARATRSLWSKFNSKSKALLASFDIKPCYVEMVRDETVEEAYKKFRKERLARMQQQCRRKPTKPLKNKVMAAGSCVQPRPKSCVPELDRTSVPKQERFFENITRVFLGKVIRTEEHYEREMNLLKPILMVHEYNVRLIDYSEEFGKNNIVYIVRENCGFPINVLINEHFISAVELGYIKLVDAGLFCKFVNGSMDLAARKHDSDHSYCLNKI